MSRREQKTQIRSCTVCKDAGLPESFYTSHWVKDSSGRPTCPTLRSRICECCHVSGHTAKYCLKAKARAGKSAYELESIAAAKRDALEKKRASERTAVSLLAVKKQGGRFADIAIDSGSDSESEKVTTPIIIAKKSLHANTILMTPLTFKTVPIDPPPIEGPTIWAHLCEERDRVREERRRAIRKGLRDGTIGWADVESSDDEE